MRTNTGQLLLYLKLKVILSLLFVLKVGIFTADTENEAYTHISNTKLSVRTSCLNFTLSRQEVHPPDHPPRVSDESHITVFRLRLLSALGGPEVAKNVA